MCLSIKVDRPECVLEEGEAHGHEYVIVHNTRGFRCGYVKVEPGHPWHGKDYDNIFGEVDVHGGLTFSKPDKACDKEGPDDGHWFGFDCAHSFDAPDPELPQATMPYPGFTSMFGGGGTVRSQDYVRAECEKLALQAKEAAEAVTA
jgi:hypothetical protein